MGVGVGRGVDVGVGVGVGVGTGVAVGMGAGVAVTSELGTSSQPAPARTTIATMHAANRAIASLGPLGKSLRPGPSVKSPNGCNEIPYGSVALAEACGVQWFSLVFPDFDCVARTFPFHQIVVVTVTLCSLPHSLLHARSETASPVWAVMLCDHG